MSERIKIRHRAPKFSISILAMGGLEMTRKCINSVLASKDPLELLLTDNASDDGTGQYFDELAAKDIRISVVHNTVNKGFGEPQNEALTRAKGEYFVCLNNDTEVPKNWLTELEKPFLQYPSAAISGPAGSCCSIVGVYPSFHGDVGPNFEYVEGSCLCIPTALARKYTLFAPYMKFAYGEDTDLSLRMRARGRTIHRADFHIIHHRGQTSRHIEGMRDIQLHNQQMLINRWSNYHQFRRFDLPIVLRRDEALGDVLLTTPLIRALRDQHPASEVYFETALPHVLKHNPHVIRGQPWERFEHVYKWARVVDLNMSYENMLKTNIVDGYFQHAMIIPSESNYRQLDNFITAEDELFAKTQMEGDRWIAVHPGPSTWRGKAWPEDRFRKLCYWLLDNRFRVALVGHQGGPSYPCHIDFRGHTSLQQLAAVIQRCKLFVGLDSYPIHVAQSMHIPVIGLFGVTRPEFILTEGKSASLVGEAPCTGARHLEAGKTQMPCDGACIDSITLEEVVASVEQLSK